jgi:hypothetical protein
MYHQAFEMVFQMLSNEDLQFMKNPILYRVLLASMLATTLSLPTLQDLGRLTSSDLVIMSTLSDAFRHGLEQYVNIDPFTTKDPFEDQDDFNYFIIVDRTEPRRIVSLIATKKNPLPQLYWGNILGNRLAKLTIPKTDAQIIKSEIMPKDNNNFYTYRCSGVISGLVMFAFQMCGRK